MNLISLYCRSKIEILEWWLRTKPTKEIQFLLGFRRINFLKVSTTLFTWYSVLHEELTSYPFLLKFVWNMGQKMCDLTSIEVEFRSMLSGSVICGLVFLKFQFTFLIQKS